MPLRTSQDAPRFLGTADDLPRYFAEVEALCRSCHRSADSEVIRYAVYYTDESSWDAFAAARDSLEGPKTWQEFKAVIFEFYPQREVAHTHTSLPASLPSPPMPTASLPSLLPAAPVTHSSPQPPAPALMLSLAALEVPLSPAVPMTPAIPTLPLSPAPDARFLEAIAAASWSPVQACPPRVPTAAPRPLPTPSNWPLRIKPLPDGVAPPPSLTTAPPPCIATAPPVAPVSKHLSVPLVPPLLPPVQAISLRPLPAPDDQPPTPYDSFFHPSRDGPTLTAAAARMAKASPTQSLSLPGPPHVPTAVPRSHSTTPAPAPKPSHVPVVAESPSDAPSLAPAVTAVLLLPGVLPALHSYSPLSPAFSRAPLRDAICLLPSPVLPPVHMRLPVSAISSPPCARPETPLDGPSVLPTDVPTVASVVRRLAPPARSLTKRPPPMPDGSKLLPYGNGLRLSREGSVPAPAVTRIMTLLQMPSLDASLPLPRLIAPPCPQPAPAVPRSPLTTAATSAPQTWPAPTEAALPLLSRAWLALLVQVRSSPILTESPSDVPLLAPHKAAAPATDPPPPACAPRLRPPPPPDKKAISLPQDGFAPTAVAMCFARISPMQSLALSGLLPVLVAAPCALPAPPASASQCPPPQVIEELPPSALPLLPADAVALPQSPAPAVMLAAAPSIPPAAPAVPPMPPPAHAPLLRPPPMPDDLQLLPVEESSGCCEGDSSRCPWLCVPRPLRPACCRFQLWPRTFRQLPPTSASARHRRHSHVTDARRSNRRSRQHSRHHPRRDPQHMRKPTTPCMEDADGIPGLLTALHDIGPVNTKIPTLAVHTHEGHTKRYPPLFTPSFPNHRGPRLMPTAPIAVHSRPRARLIFDARLTDPPTTPLSFALAHPSRHV